MVVEQGKKQIEAELLISPSTVKRIMKQFREDGVVTEPRGSRGTLHEDRKNPAQLAGPPACPSSRRWRQA
jgi:Mn-dependent DtxR family transcriptional regulator